MNRRGGKVLWVLGLIGLALNAPVEARVSHHYVRHAAYHSFGPAGGRHYRNIDGNAIHGPMQANSRPDGATAHCRDGSWSFSQHHRGTCSHHGGVASW
jgi:hypothetical protein